MVIAFHTCQPPINSGPQRGVSESQRSDYIIQHVKQYSHNALIYGNSQKHPFKFSFAIIGWWAYLEIPSNCLVGYCSKGTTVTYLNAGRWACSTCGMLRKEESVFHLPCISICTTCITWSVVHNQPASATRSNMAYNNKYWECWMNKTVV